MNKAARPSHLMRCRTGRAGAGAPASPGGRCHLRHGGCPYHGLPPLHRRGRRPSASTSPLSVVGAFSRNQEKLHAIKISLELKPRFFFGASVPYRISATRTSEATRARSGRRQPPHLSGERRRRSSTPPSGPPPRRLAPVPPAGRTPAPRPAGVTPPPSTPEGRT